MRKFVVALALLLGLIFLIVQLAEVQAIIETFRHGDWRFIFLALGVEIAWVVNLAASYRSIYRALGLEERIEKLVLMATAAQFLNVVAPSVGMGGMAVFISEARRNGQSPAKVTIAGVLFIFFELVGLLCVLGVGLLVLLRRQHLTQVEMLASAFLVAAALIIAGLIYLGMHSAQMLSYILTGAARLVNTLLRPFIHRDFVPEHQAHHFAKDASGGLQVLRGKPERLFMPAMLALSSKILLLSVLFFLFMAFQIPLSVGTIIAGYSIASLFVIVSPTPAGIGVVEGVLTLVLFSLYVPRGAAAVVTLAYRGITFWLPWFFGMFAFRWLSRDEKTLPAADMPGG